MNVLCRGCVNLIVESLRDFLHCKYLAHFCVVGCKERGGALPTVTALTAQGITIMFVVQVTVGTTHEDTQHSVNKQTN